ncbi:MAG: hypothetical protein MSIBF_06360 [Candidatus Altiarchaeales archaeon IMC4]|nr:MAG: hypothetical protein MSIBF_06360 [Candidatus Altiarchaeales archaeon IMC4]
MDKKGIVRDFEQFKDKVMGIMLFGSGAGDSQHERSDVDICIVAGDYDADKLFGELIRTRLPQKYDVKIFELLPIKLKGGVIDCHKVLWARSKPELSYYLYKWRRMWDDQKLELKKLGIQMFHAG